MPDTAETSNAVYYDPFKAEITENPYPVYRRLREEAPLYYNEEYGFYAVSRYDDVKRGLGDKENFISGRGDILEYILAGAEYPDGYFIMDDPPEHTVYRRLAARMFSPKRLNALEGLVRDLCAKCLDPLVGVERFDLMEKVGFPVPMRVIGMLLGIPEEDHEKIRLLADEKIRPRDDGGIEYNDDKYTGEAFKDYIDWRADNPSDDVMTELLNVEFTDEKGVLRKLRRDEIMAFVDLLAGAGNETTAKLIGWTGKLLAEHPDQRRDLVVNPTLIPDALEEILRFETPATHVARYVVRDAEFHGKTVPEGSALLCINASANRDEDYFEHAEQFDIHRDMKHRHLTFGTGIHTCLGAVLARLEGRVFLEEMLKRIPEWDVEWDKVKLIPTSTVRGLETLPVFTR